jgi:N-acylglucosamine 2-epimerase
MTSRRIRRLTDWHRESLLGDVLPFWLKHSVDRKHGGYFTCLDRDGSVYGRDKYVWLQGRQAWTLSRVYNEIDRKEKYLETARRGIDFLLRYCFRRDGHMYFSVTEDGRPLVQPWWVGSESFACLALAEHAKATGDVGLLRRARKVFRDMRRWAKKPSGFARIDFPGTRSYRKLADPMVILGASQEMETADPTGAYAPVSRAAAREILGAHVDSTRRAVFEYLAPDGSHPDTPSGRLANPGHAVEAAWFCMREGDRRNDPSLIARALDVLEWSLGIGWDRRHGGILYLVDVDGKPPEHLEWDMKLWWTHNEAIIALLYACLLSGERKWERWHDRVLEWALAHFPDRRYGEWFGYLHRDGSVALSAKGGMWKGCFHLPRMHIVALSLLDRMRR